MITERELWAKLGRDPSNSIVRWHSLVDHSADVAAVMLVLLEQPIIASRLAKLGGLERLDEVTRFRLGALAFLHDIGKANRGFRARVDRAAPCVGHIDQLAWLLLADDASEPGDRLGAMLGLDRVYEWFESDQAYDLLHTVFAHHGRPWRTDPIQCAGAYWRVGADGDPIADLAPMRSALDRWFAKAFVAAPALPDKSAFHHAFAGLLMLADWLGSDEKFFPFADGHAADRMSEATVLACRAVAAVGLKGISAADREGMSGLGFADIFSGRSPRPMQRDAVLPDAGVVVLEAETGSGKTEAALWRFKHLLERGEVDGLYFALPTRVAATAMFERVKIFRDRVFTGDKPGVVLAVPGQVAVDEAEGRRLPNFGFEWGDKPDGGASQARWAAEHPKRFLAARIAVGTIDQALLGAIRVKHSQMRGASLLRHLLVVDEVHASDRYMEKLLRTLLRNHAAAGGHALLLSATLGAVARARLLGTTCPDAAAAEAIPYPLMSWAAAGTECRQVPDHPASGPDQQPVVAAKLITMETAPLLDSPEDVARAALAAAADGAAVLVIRNTVGAAVATARALEALAGPDDRRLFRVGEVATLHHGRFAAADRRQLDAAVERTLGHDRLPGGCVVVGTQTLEISLDLDADLLLTDLCPADVLLQRLGRLHRHPGRRRPTGYAAPRVVVLVPVKRDLVGFAARRGGRHGLGRVYEDLRMIEATWREIEANSTWHIPKANRRLVERTTHPDHLVRIATELAAESGEAWNRHVQDNEGKLSAALNAAGSAGLDWSTAFRSLRLDEDEHLSTRLGTQDRLLNLRPDLGGAFGTPIGALRVPHFLLAEVAGDTEPTNERQGGSELRFELGSRTFVYDRYGLRVDEQA